VRNGCRAKGIWVGTWKGVGIWCWIMREALVLSIVAEKKWGCLGRGEGKSSANSIVGTRQVSRNWEKGCGGGTKSEWWEIP